MVITHCAWRPSAAPWERSRWTDGVGLRCEGVFAVKGRGLYSRIFLPRSEASARLLPTPSPRRGDGGPQKPGRPLARRGLARKKGAPVAEEVAEGKAEDKYEPIQLARPPFLARH